MTRIRKPIPKNQSEITQEAIGIPLLANEGKPISETVFSRNRGEDLSMKDDKVKTISVGLADIDEAVMYYFNNVIKPTVIQDGNKMTVPTAYASPERWKSIQQDGFHRDGNGQIIIPLVIIRRDNVEKVRNIGNKLDGNFAALYQVVGSKYNPRNAYDKFSLLNNRIPSEQFYVTAVPDYVTITYSCIIFTNFIEQNNKIIEAIEYASDSYWGDPNRWKFKASIDNFATTVNVENGADRAAKSTFNIKLNGYLIPDTVNKDIAAARNKFYTKSQVIFDLEVIDGDVNSNLIPMNGRLNASNSTSFIGGGTNVTNITLSGAAASDLTYLNTNKTLQATTVTAPGTIIFSGDILQPSIDSTLPPTTVNNFVFYVNGVYLPSSLVTLTEGVGTVTAVVNTTSLGYTLQSTDEVIAIGKWQ